MTKFGREGEIAMNDPWSFVESPFQFARRRGVDAIFTLGNGYLGCRGFFEEEQEDVEALGGIYMAGVFGEGALKAWKGMHRELVNTPNFLWMSIRVDGEQVLARPGRMSAYARTLNMRDGTMTRSFVWRSASGCKLRLDFERFISVADLHLAGQRLRITPLKGAPKIEITAGINANVVQHNMVTTIPLPIQPGRRHLKTLQVRGNMIEAQVETLPDGVRIAEGQQIRVEGPAGAITGRPSLAPGLVAERFAFTGKAGATVQLTKVAHFFTSRDGNAMGLLRKSLARAPDYDRLLASHRKAWIGKWAAADIEIEGAADDQQAVRFNLFHLMQACPGHDSRVSLGARGLSGEMHEGSIFWDNEIFKLPFFTFTDPKATRSMLRFRHRTLPEARRHAKELWFDGAMYAWKSGDDGVEETEMGVGAYYAIHIVADIAYALRQYVEATGDDDFLVKYGAEILVETARFWKSRAHYDPARKTWNILAVRGPNEYDVIVNNNCYTNMMAQENIRYALDAVARLRGEHPAAWRKLAPRLKVTATELAAWKDCARGLVICFDKARDLYAEDDMYLHRVPFDMKRGKPDARRVIDGTLPYEAMAYFQITKQSDIVTLMNLLPWKFTDRQKRVAYGFYEPKTVHDSSLSYGPHAVMAARLGMMKDAYRYFRDCAYLDLADIQLNTICGLHFANLGGTWQAVVQGFAGLWQHGGRLHLDPHLPPAWKALRFRLQYKGATLRVAMKGRTTTVTLEKAGNHPVGLMIGGTSLRFSKTGQTAAA
jgi:trehalose/maltose hydrolase-like predicted phosphorylase